MKAVLKDDFESFYDSYENENVHALRINPLKCNGTLREEVILNYCKEPVTWCTEGYYYDEDSHPGRSAFHEMGLFYIQEPSAMLVGELAGAKPGERVLDLCAAPGGKTTHLAGQLRGEGLLVSNEIDYTRAKILSRNVERMGIKNCVVTSASPDQLSKVFYGFFDRIVVDSPCSGEGMFKKEEAAVSNWSEGNVAMCAERSKTIVDEAVKMLAPGGVMVYSTCTFALEEDEYIIKYILENYPYMKLSQPEDQDLFEGLSGPVCESEYFREHSVDGKTPAIYRIWPHINTGEGHFAARLVKSGQKQESVFSDTGETVDIPNAKEVRKGGKDKKSKKTAGAFDLKPVLEFFDGNITGITVNTGRIRTIADSLWLIPDIPAGDIKTLRFGLELGMMKKDRFEPAHAFAMALDPGQVKNVFETEDPASYLAGNTIGCDGDNKGWVLITHKGAPLGWGKASGGVIKNHYPKGLRRTNIDR